MEQNNELLMQINYVGFLDKINDGLITGWVVKENHTPPFKIELYIDDEKIAETEANIFRKRVLERKLHETGNCGFRFTNRLPANKDKYQVSIRIDGQTINIKNNPYLVNKNALNVLIIGLAKSGTSALTYKIAKGLTNSKIFFEPGNRESLQDVNIHKNII